MATFDNKYTPDIDHNLINPERGMYSAATPNFGDEDDEGLLPEQVNYHTIVPEWLWLAPVCHDNLVWDPTNGTTSEVLKKYAEEKLDKARSEGYKILLRPRYDQRDPEAQEGPPPAGPSECTFEGGSAKVFHAESRDCQKNHITAIANMLGDYKDVIAFIHAGYLGNWGEWNTEAGDDDPDPFYTKENAPLLYDIAFRAEIIDHLIAEYERVGIMQHVEFRRPVFAREVLMRKEDARVGFHNDCFMSTVQEDTGFKYDYATYDNFDDCDPLHDSDCPNFESPDKAYQWAAETLTPTASFGGETCPAPEGDTERWQFCNNMTGPTSEPASLHMNYLNHDYYQGAIDKWKADGCYDEIRRRLGYRFEVRSVEYPETVSAGETFSVAVDVENTGWARLHKPRDAKLVLRNGATSHGPYTFSDGPPVSDWAPGQPAETITATVAAGGDPPPPPPGTYRVRLWIPDPDLLEFLSNAPNPEDYEKAKTHYAVRLATLRDGVNVFDPDTAENDLGVEIVVQ